MFARIATKAPLDQIEQRYTLEFVYEMAPNLNVFIDPLREVVKCPATNEAHLGISYTVRNPDGVIASHKTARIWEAAIDNETVTLVELTSSFERARLLWVFDYDEALCQAADWLAAAILAEGYVYVPKEIPATWYSEHQQQGCNDPRTSRAYTQMEGGSDNSPDDSDGFAIAGANYRNRAHRG